MIVLASNRDEAAPTGESARLSALLTNLFPAGVVGTELREPGNPELLLPGEVLDAANVVPKRLHEFAAGRICARRALAEFGIIGRALPIASDRRPLWPHDMVGSITHTSGFCGAVVAEAALFGSLGLDAEVVGRVTQELWSIVCTDAEAAWLSTLPLLERAQVGALIFCIKEAFYKCQYGITGEWLEFRDITMDLAGWDLGTGIFAIRPLKPIRLQQIQPLPWIGRFHFSAEFVFAGMAFPRSTA